uniref:uncharacterized protein LOC100180377 isoform X2 n=1 Tax=Ciona intestinalis TaxID=7719 RepID=UPI000EF53246|nr:uncharacterized protein LOC100180377 isoform X2 [Ciona intestinalis]|eukprot:XP_026690773.1 uncharacterized protein LOC100180377 isoform X2 [Ciona intestinalis]
MDGSRRAHTIYNDLVPNNGKNQEKKESRSISEECNYVQPHLETNPSPKRNSPLLHTDSFIQICPVPYNQLRKQNENKFANRINRPIERPGPIQRFSPAQLSRLTNPTTQHLLQMARPQSLTARFKIPDKEMAMVPKHHVTITEPVQRFDNGVQLMLGNNGFTMTHIKALRFLELNADWTQCPVETKSNIEKQIAKLEIAYTKGDLHVTVNTKRGHVFQVNQIKTKINEMKFELEEESFLYVLNIYLHQDVTLTRQQYDVDTEPELGSVMEEVYDVHAKFGRVTLASHPRKCRVDGCDYCLVTNNGLCLQCEHEVKHRGLHGDTISTRTPHRSIIHPHSMSRSFLDRYLHQTLSTRRTEPTAYQSDIAVDASLTIPMSSNMNSEPKCQETEVHDLSNTFETPAICLKSTCKKVAAKNALNFCEDCYREFQASRTTEFIKS